MGGGGGLPCTFSHSLFKHLSSITVSLAFLEAID
jgi:hypothetical protein